MYRYLVILCAMALVAGSAFAQAPDTLWTRTFGGAEWDAGTWIEETSDSGFIISGSTYSLGAGDVDCYIIRLTANGTHVWSDTHGGTERDEAWSVNLTAGGGFLLGGFASSFPPNGFDVHLVSFDAAGAYVDHSEIGGADTAEYLNSMCRLADGNHILVGHSSDTADYYMAKVTPGRSEIWELRLDLPGGPDANNVAATADTGFIVAGDASNSSVYVTRFSAAGGVLWQKAYTGANTEARSVVPLADSGYMVLGTRRFTGKAEDYWLLRLDGNGDTLWTRHYGNDDQDEGYCVRQTFDGGFIMTGQHYPPGQDLNIWVVRTDAAGDTLWTKSIGGSGGEYAYCIQQTADSGYVIVGRTRSYGAGNYDVYVVKLAPDPAVVVAVEDDGAVRPEGHTLGQNYPNPFNAGTRIDYALDGAGRVRITVYNVLGQSLRVVLDELRDAGIGSVLWDGRDETGREMASGLYFYRLETGSAAVTRKMVLLR